MKYKRFSLLSENNSERKEFIEFSPQSPKGLVVPVHAGHSCAFCIALYTRRGFVMITLAEQDWILYYHVSSQSP